MTIEELIKSGKAHISSSDGLRRMFYDGEQWEVWGQTRKYDRTHLIEKGSLNNCIKILCGESKASTIANDTIPKANG